MSHSTTLRPHSPTQASVLPFTVIQGGRAPGEAPSVTLDAAPTTQTEIDIAEIVTNLRAIAQRGEAAYVGGVLLLCREAARQKNVRAL